MNQLVHQFSKKHLKKNIPDLRPGDTVKVYQKIVESGKERVQIFEGIIIATNKGKGMAGSFTVRKIAVGNVGVERTYPLHTPTIVKIERLKQAKVRRAKLYYLRELQGKAARLKEKSAKQMWEEPEAEKELEKIKEEQAMQAAEKVEEKEQEQAELDKKFEQAKAHGTSETPDSGPTGGDAGTNTPAQSGSDNS